MFVMCVYIRTSTCMLKLGSSGACLQALLAGQGAQDHDIRIWIKGFLVAVTRNMAHKHTHTHTHIVLYCIVYYCRISLQKLGCM